MKRVLLVADGVVGRSVRRAIERTEEVEIVGDHAAADIAVVYTKAQVMKVLGETKLEIWQLAYSDAVDHRRVRVFDLVYDIHRFLAELAQ